MSEEHQDWDSDWLDDLDWDEDGDTEPLEQAKDTGRRLWGWAKQTAAKVGGKVTEAKEAYARYEAERERERQEWLAAEQRRREEEEESKRQQRLEAINEWINMSGVPAPEEEAPRFTTYQITVPRDTVWQPAAASAMLRSLVERFMARRSLASVHVEVIGTYTEVIWTLRLVDFQQTLSATEIETIVRPHYPQAQVSVYQYPEPALPLHRTWVVFQPSGQKEWFDYNPLASDIRGKHDPLSAIVRAMEGLQEGETLRYEVYLFNGKQLSNDEIIDQLFIDAYQAGYRYQSGYQSRSFSEQLGTQLVDEVMSRRKLKKELVPRFENENDFNRYLAKIRQPLALCKLMLTFDTPDENRLSFFEGVINAVTTNYSVPDTEVVQGYVGEAALVDTYPKWASWHPVPYLLHAIREADENGNEKESAVIEKLTFALTADELAALWHLPHMDMETPSIAWGHPQPEPILDTDEEGALVGTLGSGDTQRSVKLMQVDRQYHALATGMIGMGKTTLVEHVIRQDIAKGYGVAVPYLRAGLPLGDPQDRRAGGGGDRSPRSLDRPVAGAGDPAGAPG